MNLKRRDLATAAALAVVYFGAAKLGLRFAYVNPSATALWAPTGIALAAFLIFGFRIWPGIFLGAFLANLTTAGTVLTSIGIASGNTLEGVAGCYLVRRFARGHHVFDRAQDIFKFAFLAGMVSTTISATMGVTTLSLAGFAHWAMYGPIWRTWWLGDAVGAVVVTPLILLWRENPHLEWTRRRLIELALLLLGLSLTAWIVFGGRFHSELKNYPLEYICVPFLIWAAYSFGRRKAATATCILTGIATWGTLRGFGPFSGENPNTSLLLTQLFIGIVAITSLALAAEVTERKRAEERVRRLAVTDPLTGPANYRRLLDVLGSEIKRSGRSRRPFAVLLLDLDGLKKINDAHGHLVGSRALCRLAEVLRSHCRDVDTPARFGGDEFAVVLPETDSLQALQIATRIRQRLASEGESPPISASVGSAIFPEDGESIEKLLSAADRALYGMKRSTADSVAPGN
ncbi:MAG TPA: MASE1 domain-containing protein [Candidatus Acidoferrales bacterium]|nr:MASE1 domain-containing protein [Candidatus Acidoferrales bacterium]